MNIKFMWNGIKVDGKLYRAHFSDGVLKNHPEGTITVYCKDYDRFPDVEELTVHNDSDSMTDYFEKDRIRIEPTNKFYAQVLESVKAQSAHWEKRKAKKAA
jgi:hypothetical protein